MENLAAAKAPIIFEINRRKQKKCQAFCREFLMKHLPKVATEMLDRHLSARRELKRVA
jgi:predicted HD phosphohydrolase